MVDEKKVFKILYEVLIEVYGVDEEGYDCWKDNEPSDQDFIEAIKYDVRKAFSREDSCLTQLNYWTHDEKIERLSVERIRRYPKK